MMNTSTPPPHTSGMCRILKLGVQTVTPPIDMDRSVRRANLVHHEREVSMGPGVGPQRVQGQIPRGEPQGTKLPEIQAIQGNKQALNLF